LRAVRYNSVEIVATGYCSNNHHLVLEGIGKKSWLPKDIKRKAKACGISITSDTALRKQRAFSNSFQPPVSPSLGGSTMSGHIPMSLCHSDPFCEGEESGRPFVALRVTWGHPQTPSKGALPLCTPQLLNNIKASPCAAYIGQL